MQLNQEKAIIISKLYNQDVCIRCIFRILGINEINLFRDRSLYSPFLIEVGQILGDEKLLIEEYDFLRLKKKSQVQQLSQNHPQIHSSLKEFIIHKPFYKIENSNNCSICLGILQSVDDNQLIQSLIDTINQRDYDFEAFKFAVKAPIGIQIRQILILNNIALELQSEGALIFNICQPQFTIDIKVCVKWIMSQLISDCLQKRSDAQDDRFQINLQYENLFDDIEQFKPFKELVELQDDRFWEEKIKKKVKQNDPQLQEEMKQRLLQKKNNKQQQFLPNQTNLEKILKLSTVELSTIQQPQSNYETKLDVNTQYQNIFLKGNYIKLARFISQTPWVIEGKQMYEDSISDLIEQRAKAIFKPSSNKFHSGGREDIDVRMLGEGRPFVLELVDPHKSLHNRTQVVLNDIENYINSKNTVKVTTLSYTDNTCFADLKNSETNKVKAYCCIVQCSKEINQQLIEQLNNKLEIVLDQKTPLRVLHRRTLMIRKKIIHALHLKQISPQWFQVYVLSSAGTYIKEFIHGDLERTLPNLGTLLGCECDIFQLDVIKLYEKIDDEVLKDFKTLDTQYGSVCNADDIFNSKLQN